MSAARAIRRSVEDPGLVTCFAVATASALLVLLIAGYQAASLSADAEPGESVPVSALVPSNASASSSTSTWGPRAQPQEASVLVEAKRLVPSIIHVTAGRPTRLAFVGGASDVPEVSFSSVDVHALPRDDGRLEVMVPALSPGTYPFTCGAECGSGAVVVE